jgi:hypothetical protein
MKSSGLENSSINPHSFGSPKEHKTHNGEKTASSTNVAGKKEYPHIQD